MIHEGVLLESRTMRGTVIGRVEVLDRVKELALCPDGLHATTSDVARYFGVGVAAVHSVVFDHRAELESNGYHVLTGSRLTSFKEVSGISSRTRSLALFPRRAVLNVAMLLRDSEVARQVRAYLLDAEYAQRARVSTPPVDNFGHRLGDLLHEYVSSEVASRLEEFTDDERTVRVAEDVVRTAIGTSVVTLLNVAIEHDLERRGDVAELRAEFRSEIERLEREQRRQTLTK